jgi:hypothetical protein
MRSNGFRKSGNGLVACFLFFAISLPSSGGADRRKGAPPPETGYWSSEARIIPNTWVYPLYTWTSVKIDSPDHKSSINGVGDDVSVTIGDKTLATTFGKKTDVEVGWAPDSKRFFVSRTDGGLVGRWHVEVYEVSAGGLREIKDIEKRPRHDFDQLVRRLPRPANTLTEQEKAFWESARYCYSNVVGAQWVKGSNELLVSVMVEPEGDCKQGGEFRVYRVAVPSGAILQRYGEEEAHRLFRAENMPAIQRD